MDQLSSEEEIVDANEVKFIPISLSPLPLPSIELKMARSFSSFHFTFQSVIENLDRPPKV